MGVSIEKINLVTVLLRSKDPLISAMFPFALPEKQVSVNIVLILRQTICFSFVTNRIMDLVPVGVTTPFDKALKLYTPKVLLKMGDHNFAEFKSLEAYLHSNYLT